MSDCGCDYTCACSVYATGVCSCFPPTPTVDALVARAAGDLSINRMLFLKHLYVTNRIAEFNAARRTA